jgi:hypothetical protein
MNSRELMALFFTFAVCYATVLIVFRLVQDVLSWWKNFHAKKTRSS